MATLKSFSAPISILDTTTSNSITTGALIIAGGIGIAGTLNIGGVLTASSGLTGTSVSVTGNVNSLRHTITGSTSGVITIQAQAAAGTYNYNLPITAGTAGQFLTSQGGGASPMTWTTIAGTGTVTSVSASVPVFLNITGSPITTSGTLAIGLSGTALPVLNGGTGTTTSTGSGSVVLSNTPTFITPVLGAATGTSLSLSSTITTSGLITGNSLLAFANTAIGTQGLFMQWNRNLLGESWIINQKGGGTGGIRFGESTNVNVVTENMRIETVGITIPATTASTSSTTGALIVSGGVGIGGLINTTYTANSQSNSFLYSGMATGNNVGLWIGKNTSAKNALRLVYNHQNDASNNNYFSFDFNSQNNVLTGTAGGNVGIGISAPNCPLQFANTAVNRKIVLWEDVNNEHQYYGFGINTGILRYQTPTTGSSHVFYAAASLSTSNELFRIAGTGHAILGTTTTGNGIAYTIQNSGTANCDLGIAGTSANFSSSALQGDSILRASQKLILQSGIGGGALIINSSNIVSIPGTTSSTSTTSGALTVAGGIGISNTTNATSSTNGGSFTTAGGVAVAGSTYLGADLQVSNAIRFVNFSGINYIQSGANLTANSAAALSFGPMSSTTSWLSVNSTSVNVSGFLFANQNAEPPTFNTRSSGTKYVLYSGIGISNLEYALGIENNNMWFSTNSGFKWYNNTLTASMQLTTTQLSIAHPTPSTSSITGALVVTGGVGIGGNVNITSSSAAISLRATAESQSVFLYLSTPFDTGSANKTAIISQGVTSFSRSKLHLCVNNVADNITAVSVTDARLTVDTNGNIGIGTTSPVSRLDIASNGTAVDALLNINESTHDTSRRAAMLFGTGWAMGQDLGTGGTKDFFIYGGSPATTKFYISTSGNIGIGTTSPNCPLQLANTSGNRKIVLWEEANNEHQYHGFGINAGILRYQIPTTGNSHVFYAATSSTTSNEIFRIAGDGTAILTGSSPALTIATSAGASGAVYLGNSSHGISRDSSNNVIVYTAGGSGQIALRANGFGGGNQLLVNPNGNTTISNNLYVKDIYTSRGDSTGAIFFGNTNQFIYYNGTSFEFTKQINAEAIAVNGANNGTRYSTHWCNGGGIAATNETRSDYCAWFGGWVNFGVGWRVNSDSRIKENITTIKSNIKFEKIRPVSYNLIDNLIDKRLQNGFIAQEIEELYPNAVFNKSDYLPNIMKNVKVISKKTFDFIGNLTGKILVYIYPNNIQTRTEVNIIKQNGNIYTIDTEIPSDELFIYGSFEEDVKSVNYTFFIPELVAELQASNKRIENLEKLIEKLSSKKL